VNAALLVISSALATGGDVTPVRGWGESPTIVQAGGCCAPAAAPSCGCAKATLLDKIKSHMAPKSHCGCEQAPTCDSCGSSSYRPNLLDKLKAGCCKKSSCECGPVASPCATPITPIAPVPPPTTLPPKDMPKLKEIPKTTTPPKTSGNSGLAPIPSVPSVPPIAPSPSGLPAIPSAPISSGTSSGGSSPY
jgi:hypothetical protein